MNVTKTEKGYAISINEDTTIELDNAVADAQPNAGSSDDASDSEVEALLKGLDID